MKAEYDFSRGRRGPAISTEGKTRMTIYLDNWILESLEEQSARTGTGYQTLINNALAQSLGQCDVAVTTETGPCGGEPRYPG
jgi:uncharacterized protein (DUF4415 family)